MMGDPVSGLGEFALIRRLAARLGPARRDVVVGIGDDVAAVEVRGDRYLLMTCDAQVAGVHFLPGVTPPERVGRKAAAVNLSDVAAAGGRPTHFLVSLLLPPDTAVEWMEAAYDGIAHEAALFGADVVGGNVARAGQLALDLTLLGEVERDRIVRRAGARPGDLVLVTGSPGMARAGLALLTQPAPGLADEERRRLVDAYQLPVPRIREARAMGDVGESRR
ncbi:MAG: thiamine-phosphate kinase [Limnochordaceae bacterium]|nr:thiamine-phosphate kinase [Limnochordaceae bacterium]